VLQLALDEPDGQVAIWSVDKGCDHVEGRPLVLQLALDEPDGQVAIRPVDKGCDHVEGWSLVFQPEPS
jgi:hypothetical protein